MTFFDDMERWLNGAPETLHRDEIRTIITSIKDKAHKDRWDQWKRMRLRFYKAYYCTHCHKLYCIDSDRSEQIITIHTPTKVAPRLCLACQTVWSQFEQSLVWRENQAVQEAYRIITKNDE